MKGRMSRREKKEQEARKRVEEQKRICREILFHAEELTGEINLRLILEQETDEKILFVESVTVTDIRFPEENRKTGFLRRIGRTLKTRLRQIKKIFGPYPKAAVRTAGKAGTRLKNNR